MNGALGAISYAVPLTYAYDGLARVSSSAPLDGRLARDVGTVLGATVLACSQR